MFRDAGRTRTLLLLAVLCASGVSGCGKKNAKSGSDSDEGTGNPITNQHIGATPADNDVLRGAQRQIVQNALEEIATVYIQLNLDNNRSPADKDELLANIKTFPFDWQKALKDGSIVMVVPKARLTANTVILYEKNEYKKWNNRVAAFGDGHVKLMPESDFQAALKAGGQ